MKYNLTPEQQIKVKELQRMSPKQWESICKGCGLCCLCKVAFDSSKTSNTYYTTVHCSGLDPKTKKCKIYDKRLQLKGADCKKLSIDIILEGQLVPRTCGYVEYVFGPAPFKISLDWRTVKSEQFVELNNPLNLIQNLILESHQWNKS